MQDEFECSRCKQPKKRSDFHERNDSQRPVTSRCRDCRSDARYTRKFPNQTCAQCLKHRALNKNKVCAGCNEESGLRQCVKCNELLPMYLQFHGRRKACKPCRSPKPLSKPLS